MIKQTVQCLIIYWSKILTKDINEIVDLLPFSLEKVTDKKIKIIQNLVYGGKCTNDEPSKMTTSWEMIG